jgi:hypothetical protein
LLVVGQEYRPPFYGHVFLLGLRQHLISPYTTGYEGTAIESLYPSNTDILRKARLQGATVGYVHAFGGEQDPLLSDLGGAKGYIVDAALETTDAVEWSAAGRAGFFPWYATLNNGLRITAVGGEDSISNLHRSKLVGSVRTYVYTGARGLDMDAWFTGLRQGRAFVSTGPLLELSVEGQRPGSLLRVSAPGDEGEVSVSIRSIVALGTAFLVLNGDRIADIPLEENQTEVEFTTRLTLEQSGWLHARVEGVPGRCFPLDCSYAQAFTNPIWIQVGSRPVRSRQAAEYSIRWIDKLKDMANNWPGWRSQAEREHVLEQFQQARRIYQEFQQEAERVSAESP